MEFIWKKLEVWMKFNIRLMENVVLDKRRRLYVCIWVLLLNILLMGIIEFLNFCFVMKNLVS